MGEYVAEPVVDSHYPAGPSVLREYGRRHAVPCTYDLEVVASKYFYALEDGEVPLEFLFSGTVFYAGEGGRLQIARISWEKEAEYRMPVRLWKEMMERYFPNSAWIRLRKDAFDQLYDYKVRMALPTWEAAVEALLRTSEQEVER